MSQFDETQWSLVLAAGNSRSPEFEGALAQLCERYWYPIYAYVRRWGVPPDQAQDVTQGFFCRVVEKRTFRAADRERGKFRTFLLSALKYYLADERDRERALKRGGGISVASLDMDHAEERYSLESDADESPDRLFERHWALQVLARAQDRLRDEIETGTHPDRVALLQFLTESARSYREVGEELGMKESAVKVAVHRLRQRFGRLLRDEVSATLEDGHHVEDELRHLLEAVSRS